MSGLAATRLSPSGFDGVACCRRVKRGHDTYVRLWLVTYYYTLLHDTTSLLSPAVGYCRTPRLA